jgi:hypothetical protein
MDNTPEHALALCRYTGPAQVPPVSGAIVLSSFPFPLSQLLAVPAAAPDAAV